MKSDRFFNSLVLALFFGLGFGGCNGSKFETNLRCDRFEACSEENLGCNLYHFDHVKVLYNLIYIYIYGTFFIFGDVFDFGT